MLAAAIVRGLPTDDYLNPSHPVQVANRAMLARYADCKPEDVVTATDGCSAPTFALSLRRAAAAFARFVESAEPDAIDLRRAVAADPVLYAGRGRTCTKLLEAVGPELFPKAGAEGFYALGLKGPGLGVAVKFDDGSHRRDGARSSRRSCFEVRSRPFDADRPCRRADRPDRRHR
jgi:L-asparaginase II